MNKATARKVTTLSLSDQAEYRLEALKLAQQVAQQSGRVTTSAQVLESARVMYRFIVGEEDKAAKT